MPDTQIEHRAHLMAIVVREIAAVLPHISPEESARLARSLVATVHGHCSFALGGSFALLGETSPLELAMQRVNDALRAYGPGFTEAPGSRAG